MSAVELRAEINALIDRVDDSFLKVVYSMLDTYIQEQESNPVIGYDIDGNALLADEAKEEYARRVAAMKAGQKTTIEALKEEAAKW